jgi:hypothetical protein
MTLDHWGLLFPLNHVPIKFSLERMVPDKA